MSNKVIHIAKDLLNINDDLRLIISVTLKQLSMNLKYTYLNKSGEALLLDLEVSEDKQ